MSETTEEFRISRIGTMITKEIYRVFEGEAGLSAVCADVLLACQKARACSIDIDRHSRRVDSEFRKETRKPKHEKRVRELADLLRRYPDRFDKPLAEILNRIGLNGFGSPVEIVAQLLVQLGDSFGPISSSKGKWAVFYRRRVFNLAYPEDLDAGERGRKLPSKCICLAFEIEYLLRCWYNGWQESLPQRIFKHRMPDCQRNFFESATEIANLALGDVEDIIEARTLEQLLRQNHDLSLAEWPVGYRRQGASVTFNAIKPH